MICATYNWDQAKQHMAIKLATRLTKALETEEGFKIADTPNHLENAIGKHYSESENKAMMSIDILIVQDNVYLHSVAHLLRNYCRGMYNQFQITIRLVV